LRRLLPSGVLGSKRGSQPKPREMKSPPKYVAEIRQVQEVALHGWADLGFWSDRLRPQGLDAVSDDNRAQLVLTAVAARWMGI
jgi:hypothetical protein